MARRFSAAEIVSPFEIPFCMPENCSLWRKVRRDLAGGFGAVAGFDRDDHDLGPGDASRAVGGDERTETVLPAFSSKRPCCATACTSAGG